MEKREIFILILLIVIVIFLFGIWYELQILLYWETPNYEDTLQRIDLLHNINMELNDKLLEQESYTFISSEAAREGFIKSIFISP